MLMGSEIVKRGYGTSYEMVLLGIPISVAYSLL